MKPSDVRLILACRCRDSSFLASESLDRPLTFSERWAMRLHNLVCARCLRFARQLRQLHAAIQAIPASVRQAMIRTSCVLRPEAKRRIIDAMREVQ